jgi:hypothetical protein
MARHQSRTATTYLNDRQGLADMNPNKNCLASRARRRYDASVGGTCPPWPAALEVEIDAPLHSLLQGGRMGTG